MKCLKCGEDLIACESGTTQTLLGYQSMPGHDRDDNCLIKIYYCKNNHVQRVSKRRRCPNSDCDWMGKDVCFCHPGKKVDEWPEVPEARSPWWQIKKT